MNSKHCMLWDAASAGIQEQERQRTAGSRAGSAEGASGGRKQPLAGGLDTGPRKAPKLQRAEAPKPRVRAENSGCALLPQKLASTSRKSNSAAPGGSSLASGGGAQPGPVPRASPCQSPKDVGVRRSAATKRKLQM